MASPHDSTATMAANENNDLQQHLSLPAITALRDETATTLGARAPARMDRTVSTDMRSEREDLQNAAEQTLNVILDLALDGTIRWVSPSWKEVVGFSAESVKGKPIAELLQSSKDAFTNAINTMKKDDSKSQLIRFRLHMGPLSVLKQVFCEKDEASMEVDDNHEDTEEQFINLKGQGIMVYDRTSGDESHVCMLSSCMV